MWRACFPDRIKDLMGVLWMAENFIAKLTRIPRTAHNDRGPVKITDTSNAQSEPAQFLDRWLGRGRPDYVFKDIAGFWSLDRHVTVMISGTAHPNVHPPLLRLLPQPQPGLIIAPYPTEIGFSKFKNGPVINHAAVLVTHRRINDPAHGEPFHITRNTKLQECFGIRARHLIFAQGREIHNHRFFTHSPIFFDGSMVGHILCEPITRVFDKITRMARKTVVKPSFLSFFHVSPWCFAPPDRALKIFGFLIGPNLNISRSPCICWINVTRTSR